MSSQFKGFEPNGVFLLVQMESWVRILKILGFIQDNPIFFKNDYFIPLVNFEIAVLKNGLYDLVLDSTVGKRTNEIHVY